MADSSKLASYLASRIFHDLVSPLTAMMNGAELAFDDSMGPAMQAEGVKLLREGLNGIEAKIQFMRFAVGSQALSDDWVDIHAAKALFDKLFSIHKAKLNWQASTLYVTNRQMRLLMNMTLIMLEPAARNGTVKVSIREEGPELVLDVESVGSPGELKHDVQEGLAGRESERGFGGGSVQPMFTKLIADEVGFTLGARRIEGGAGLMARGPKKVD